MSVRDRALDIVLMWMVEQEDPASYATDLGFIRARKLGVTQLAKTCKAATAILMPRLKLMKASYEAYHAEEMKEFRAKMKRYEKMVQTKAREALEEYGGDIGRWIVFFDNHLTYSGNLFCSTSTDKANFLASGKFMIPRKRSHPPLKRQDWEWIETTDYSDW